MDLRRRLEAALTGRYAVEHEIGRGGMSVVFLARDLRHSREVAVKVLRPELAASLGPERFLREIQVAAGLAHPHIVPLYDSGEADGCLFYVMPYIPGESLRDRLLREGRLGVSEAVALTREVADALEFAHRAGVVHRDIKPENILLQAGHAVVADFGIARAISAAGGDRMTASGIAVGTPDYMSPEQAAGDEHVDGRSDIYSLGCVAFEMLVGRPPFSGTTPQKVLAQKLGAAAPSLSALEPVPGAVSRAVARALQKLPEDRFPTAADFAAALSDVGRGRGLRLGRGAAAVAALGVVATLAFGWQWRRAHREDRATAGPDPTHIAVLYFDVLNDSAQLGSVASGITEDLIDALERVPTLTVISAAGVRPLRNHTPPPDSVARAFSVGTIVSGSVSRSADAVRVAVRLVEAASGRQLYSESFERAPGDLLVLEDSLTEDIAQFLRRQLGAAIALRARPTATRNAEAWELVRRSTELREYARQLSVSDGDAARRAYRQADSVAAQAAALDPRWIEPLLQRGWIAWSRAVVSVSRESNGPQSQFMAAIADGLTFAARALELSPADSRALELRGFLRYQEWTLRSGDTLQRAAAETDLRDAVSADPSRATAWYALSEVLSSKGEMAEAEAAARKAYDKDAYLQEAETVIPLLFFATLGRGEFTDAGHWCAEGQRRYPGNPNFLECRLTLLGWSGKGSADIAAAWREVARLDTVALVADGRPYRLLLVAAVVARSGSKDSAEAVVRQTRRAFPHADLDLQEASVRILQGEREAALQLLTAFLHQHPGYRGYVANHYWFRALQDDPRFAGLTGNVDR